MSRPADFSPTVRDALARRAGFACAFPGCGVVTVGPSAETEVASSNTGMACHIAAAASGGSARRVVDTATPEQLADISNGIWMCYRHGKLIDTDEATYTIPMLQTWRAISELKAKLRHEQGLEIGLDPAKMGEFLLPVDDIPIARLGTENKLIGDALHNSCVAEIWGRAVRDAIRDAAIELVRNAYLHGGAKTVRMVIAASSISVEDDGAEFNSGSLRVGPPCGGGGLSLRILTEHFRSSVVFSYARKSETNVCSFILVRSASDLARFSPCTVQISFEEMHAGTAVVSAVAGCEHTFVLLPPYFALSDVFKLPDLLGKAFPDSRRCVVVCNTLSEGAVALIKERMPGVEVLVLG